MFVGESDTAHAVSKFLGGQGVLTLVTLGASQLGSATNLAHTTSKAGHLSITSDGAIVGRSGIFALNNPSEYSWLNWFRTMGAPATETVQITGAAASQFQPIPVVGPISAFTRLMGGYFASGTSALSFLGFGIYIISVICYDGGFHQRGGFAMNKIYIVRLSGDERQICHAVVKKLKGTSQKVRRANILLKADADGPKWTDKQIADAFFCTTQAVENVRKKLVTEGFDIALNGKKRETPPRQKRLDGKQEAQVIALRLSDPPKGRNAWTLRLLAEKIVELEIAPAISRSTVQHTLKKIKLQKEKCNTG
jgi:hypothetical protein